ncbi:MAG: hypothetical protein HYY24_17555 [Verrucomicrobia bacterium]|nr:hypothetical protein [Verrucomicrobiota bacterium]
MNEARRFGAPWCTLLKVVSVLAAAVVSAVPLVGALVVPQMPPALRWLLVATPVVVLVPTALLTVRGYELAGRELLIRRLLWTTRIWLEGLRSVEADPEAVRRSIRLCGNGGLFGFTGWFWNKQLRTHRVLVTDPKRAVVLRLSQRTLVVSPDDPERFVRDVKALTGLR